MLYVSFSATSSNKRHHTPGTCLNTATNATTPPPPPKALRSVGHQVRHVTTTTNDNDYDEKAAGLETSNGMAAGARDVSRAPGTFFFNFFIVLISPRVSTRTKVAPCEQPTVAGEGKRAQTTRLGPRWVFFLSMYFLLIINVYCCTLWNTRRGGRWRRKQVIFFFPSCFINTNWCFIVYIPCNLRNARQGGSSVKIGFGVVWATIFFSSSFFLILTNILWYIWVINYEIRDRGLDGWPRWRKCQVSIFSFAFY